MMTIAPNSDPNIAAFFSSSDLEKAAKIDSALKDHRLDFVYGIINRPECSQAILKSVFKGCIDYDSSSFLAIEVIRKRVFDNYQEKKTALFSAVQKGESAIVEELVKMDLDQIELNPHDQQEAIQIAIEACEKSDIDPASLNRFLEIIISLLKKGSLPENKESIMSLAIRANHSPLIEQLL